MNRTLWKVLLVISIVMLILCLVLMLIIWAGSHVLLGILVGMTSGETINAQGFGEFYENFPGSPMSYIMLASGVGIVLSSGILIFTRKKKLNSKPPA